MRSIAAVRRRVAIAVRLVRSLSGLTDLDGPSADPEDQVGPESWALGPGEPKNLACPARIASRGAPRFQRPRSINSARSASCSRSRAATQASQVLQKRKPARTAVAGTPEQIEQRVSPTLIVPDPMTATLRASLSMLQVELCSAAAGDQLVVVDLLDAEPISQPALALPALSAGPLARASRTRQQRRPVQRAAAGAPASGSARPVAQRRTARGWQTGQRWHADRVALEVEQHEASSWSSPTIPEPWAIAAKWGSSPAGT